MEGYKTDVFEFVSSRYTVKNIMLRAQKASLWYQDTLKADYEQIREEFNIVPKLEKYIKCGI